MQKNLILENQFGEVSENFILGNDEAINDLLPSQTGQSGKFLSTDGTHSSWQSAGAGSGTVTSVGLSLPSIFDVTSSPVTSSGTLTAELNVQSTNLVLSGPASGSSVAPTFKTPFQQARITFDGQGSTLTTGHKVWYSCPFAGTITGWVLLGDQSGSIDISVKKCTYTAFDTVSSITASNDPSISSAIKNQDTTLTGWTKPVLAGDILEFQISSVTNFQHVQLFLNIGGV